MYLEFKNLSPKARCWIYILQSPLTKVLFKKLDFELNKVCENWVSHGENINSNYKITDKQFIILFAEENNVSGCSIDALNNEMIRISNVLGIGLKANSKIWDSNKILIQDDSDGNGPYIKEWNIDGLAKPSDSQIASYETAGNSEENNNAVISTRQKLYGSWESQLEEINEQGIDAWKSRIAQIKSDNPKE